MNYKSGDIVLGIANTLYKILYVSYTSRSNSTPTWATALNLTTGQSAVLSLPNPMITDTIIEKITDLEILIYNVDEELL